MSRKRVLITLPADAYRRLAELADQEERVIDQQASLLLRRMLAEPLSPASGALSGPMDRRQQVGVQVDGPADEIAESLTHCVVDGGIS